MKNLIAWAWAFVPAPAKIYVKIGLIAAAVLALGFLVYKIDSFGYNRCEAKHTTAALVAVDKKLDTKAKQDEVQNAPIDNRTTVRRLRNGSF